MKAFKQVKSKIIIKTLRYFFLALLVSVQVLAAFAQLKFTTVVSSNEIGRSDYVQVQFVISNAKQIDQFSPPSFPDFQIVEGPSQSSGMSNINGNISQYQSVSYVLQPTKTGKFSIAGATANVDGKQMRSNSVSINVTTNSSGNARNNSTIQPFFHPIWPDEAQEENKEYILKPGENVSDVIRKNLFVKVQVSKNKCYVGEPIVATYKLYSCLRSESRVTKLPSMNGFSVYDMIDPNKNAPTFETINGKRFTVHIIRRAQLIPLVSGTVQLEPVQIDNDVYFVKGRQRTRHHNNLLDDFFDNFSDEEAGNMIQQHVTLNSKPVEINIEALPEKNKPADFSGAVGNFSVDAVVENKKIAARDEATLKITVKGSGNLPIINAPQIAWPSTIEGYDATAKESVDKTLAPMAGSKSFEYTFSPKQTGDYTIPAIDFSYFDPATNSYKTAKTQALNFYASAENKKAKSAKNYASDLSKQDDSNAFKSFLQDHLEWIFALIILSSVGVYLWKQNVKHKKNEAEKQAVLKLEREKPVLSPEESDPLSRAKRFLEYTDYKSFYEELNRSVWNVLRDKLQIRSSELNKYNVIKQLQLRGWNEHDIIHLEDILNKCAMNLYTPDYSEINSQQLLHETEHLLSKV
jgi:oxygen tolerance protein BatD